MTLVELMIAIAIGSMLTLGFMSMFKSQVQGSVDQEVFVSRLDLEKPVIELFSKDDVCSFLLSDPSQSSTASPPNRSIDSFDASITTSLNPAIINVANLPVKNSATSPVFASVGKPASLLSTKLIITKMKFNIRPSVPPDLFLADFEIEFNQPLKTRKINNILIQDIQIETDSTSPTSAKTIIGCGLKESLAQRIIFTTTSTWTVPVGIRKVFVSMAGGGGSGLGWRISSNSSTGHSGGYVFSQPVNVTPGEVMQVVVGKGGKGYAPLSTGIPATPGPPYFIHKNPPGDDGLGGYPGEASKFISPVFGNLLECAGGSGATVGGIDNYSGSQVAGDLAGATTGSGSPTSTSPNRVAAGIYANAGGPGRCGPGPASYGLGNPGTTKWGLQSGSKPGGITPFGRGSGGEVSIYGCYVNATLVGTCIFPADGRDGIVYIDIW